MADDNQVTRTTVMHPLPSPSIADYDDYEAVANANGNDQVSFGLESVNDEESPPPPISGDVSLIQHEEGADEMKKPKVTVEVGGGRLVDGFAEQSTAEEGPVAFAVGRFDDSVAVMQAKKGDRTTSTTLSSATPGHDDEVENELDDDGERRAATEEYGNSNSNIVAHEQDVRTTIITAESQDISTYINDGTYQIHVPEATLVTDERDIMLTSLDSSMIPSASLVQPEKYSLTIAGRKVRFRYLALGALVLLGVVVAVAVVLVKKGEGRWLMTVLPV
eukprot:g13172.t1 g13172   contig8:77989-79002(+)